MLIMIKGYWAFERNGEIKECARGNNAPVVFLRCSMNKYNASVDQGDCPAKSQYQYFFIKRS